MGFKDLNLNYSYNTEDNNVIDAFYIPVLSEAIEYKRAVAYFNSKSLSIAATGIKNFILNNGKMELLCGAELYPEDVKAITDATSNPEEILSSYFLKDIENLDDEIKLHHIQVLGWMIANNQLKIKIALKLDEFGYPRINSEGILHYKIGVLKDKEGNYLSFSGSNNETSAALGKNFECFDVFKGWDSHQVNYLRNHINLFNSTWDGAKSQYLVMDVPTAVKNKLVDIAPDNFEDLVFHKDETLFYEDICLDVGSKIELFDYQLDAINGWLENNSRGLFAMATGTGKTFTSLGALERMIDKEKKLVTIITVPNMHLIPQWVNSIEKYGLDKKIDEFIIVDSAHANGKGLFKKAIGNLYNEIIDNIVILITHDSFYKNDFTNVIKNNTDFCKFLLIADEMHALGSYNRRKGLINEYDYVLGLSATPERHFDDFGTQFLIDYFGDYQYEFSLEKALTEINPLTHQTYLTPFEYHPYFLNLNSNELEKYQKISQQLVIEQGKKNKDLKKIEDLLINRSRIIKNAEGKLNVLKHILEDLNDDIGGLIIYCSDQQIDDVVDLVGNYFNYDVSKFTSEKSANSSKGKKSKREEILEDFANGTFQVLVAMKCLDEGVDVPSASKAILMCNTTNKREFIQRIGRVIRRDDDKSQADIYDLVIEPSKRINEFSNVEQSIYEKELERCKLIANLAINSVSVILKL